MKRDRKLLLSLATVVALAILSLIGFFVGNTPVMGLDLRGGIEVVLQAPKGTPASVMNQALESIRRRVDALGVAEPNLSIVGNTIQVQLPGAVGGSIKQQPTDLYCLIGTGAQSYGCFRTQASANAAAPAPNPGKLAPSPSPSPTPSGKASASPSPSPNVSTHMTVVAQVTQSCLLGANHKQLVDSTGIPACFPSVADATAAQKALTVQGATASGSPVPTPSPASSPSIGPQAGPGASGTKSKPSPSAAPSASPNPNAVTQYCVTSSTGQTYGCYPTQKQAQAAMSGVTISTTTQYCLSRAPQGGTACYTTTPAAAAALASIGVQHVSVNYCVYNSAGANIGCFQSSAQANDKLQSIGQNHILEVIGTTARLEQRPVLYDSSGNPEIIGKSSPQWASTAVTCPNEVTQSTPACSSKALSGQDVVFLWKDGTLKYRLGPVAITGDAISKATAVFQTGSATTGGPTGWIVNFTLTSAGSAKFAQVTQALAPQVPGGQGKQLAIVLDNQVISAPSVQSAITGGSGQITGGFTELQAKDLATTLNAGALPVQLTRQAVQTVSATLGKESLKQGLVAALVGLVLLMAYLAFYYRILGLVTWVGMGIWACLALGIVGLLGQHAGYALTLAGVAGLVVSLGITADSYIVFYERLKDEVRNGKSPRSAIQPAFKKAWRTIVAADIVTVLAAAVLYVVAISSVRGFALTLGVCTFLDMFVVYFFKRPTVFLMARSERLLNLHGFGLASGVAADEPVGAKAGASP